MKFRIVTLDLRGLDGPRAIEAAHRLLADERDVTHMLFVDSASLLDEHAGCYEFLLGIANRVERHLFVIAGRQDDRRDDRQDGGHEGGHEDGRHDTGRSLVLPGTLRQAVIWVPDPIGIDWPYRAGAAAKRHVGHAADEGLQRLIEILGIPDVFLRALSLVEDLPYGLACPALRLGTGEPREHDEFRWALRPALDQLLLPSDVVLHPVDDLVTPAAGKDPLRPGGRLAGEVQTAGNAIEDAQHLLGRLVRRGALYTALDPVPDALRIAGDQLDALWAGLEKFLTDVEISEYPEDVIAAHGLVLNARPSAASEDAGLGELRTMVDRSTRRWLADGASLPQIEESVRAWADRLGADGSLRAALRAARPGELIDTLRAPPPFPAPQKWLPLVGGALAALAGLGPLTIVTGVFAGLVWSGLGLLSVVKAPNANLAGNRFFVAGNAVLALAGGVGGGLAARELAEREASVPLTLWAVALAVAIVGGIAVPAWAFARRAQVWTRMIQVERGLAALDGLRSWFGRLSAEWSALPLRSAFRGLLQKAEFAVTGTRKALAERRSRLLNETTGRPPHVPAAFLQTVRRQLSALVVTTLRPSLATLGEGDPATHARNAVARAQKRLAELQDHADEPGSGTPEWLTADLETEPIADISEDLAELARAAAYDPTQEMWQLCGATDVGLLDVVPGLPHAVRFAPLRARSSFGSLVPADTVWGPAGQSGVLRLTGLRTGAVEWSWGDRPEGQIGADW